ncbi:MAG: phospholipid carrier-dependent glycosyltransferase [Candidatus Moraniibacteriota bacterium]|jgi:dolichyl-phosphate-mannose-protein mannosyltransferase
MPFKKTIYLPVILLFLSFLTHFAFWGKPKEVVFDEVHFGKFINAYYTHEYYFDIHPPLGKLIIFGFSNFLNFQSDYAFTNIGEVFTNNEYLKLRFLPTLAGTLLPLIIFYLCLELNFSAKASFFVGFLLSIENTLVVQSRFIFLDSFLLLFGFGSLLCFFLYRRKKIAHYLILTGILGAMAFSIKWTGMSFLFLAGLVELILLIKNKNKLKKTNFSLLILSFLIIPLLTYFSIFAIHFSLLSKAGQGDAFMSKEFQHTLENNTLKENKEIKDKNTIHKFIELNLEMYRANKNLTSTHPYSSQWFSWPIMQRPIYYWNNINARIYLIGNPIIWWSAFLAVIIAFFELFKNRKNNKTILIFLLGGYFLNWLPFMLISRVMFLYHYLTALIFSIMILVYILDKRKMQKLGLGLILIACILFIYFSPLTYGSALDYVNFENRLWLKSWQ